MRYLVTVEMEEDPHRPLISDEELLRLRLNSRYVKVLGIEVTPEADTSDGSEIFRGIRFGPRTTLVQLMVALYDCRYRGSGCYAKAGEPCRTYMGRRVTSPHASRWDQYDADPAAQELYKRLRSDLFQFATDYLGRTTPI